MVVHCTTIARVKRRIGQLHDDTQDAALLAQWITDVSDLIERHLGRWLEKKNRVEVQSTTLGSTVAFVMGYPIDEVTSIEEDPLGHFSSVLPNVQFGQIADLGKLVFTGQPLVGGVGSLRISYRGGMAATTDLFVQAFPAIASAADSQIAYWYRRRHTDGLANVAGTQAGGASVQGESMQLTPGVVSMLDPFRRMDL